MLGIDDPLVWLAYLLCLASTALCVLYSWRNWNRGDDRLQDEDRQWARKEDRLEQDL